MADISEAMVEAALNASGHRNAEYSRTWMRAALEAALSAAPASAQMEGMVLVPREPTAKMRVAGIEAAYAQEKLGAPICDMVRSAYRAMVAAAPLPTSEGSSHG